MSKQCRFDEPGKTLGVHGCSPADALTNYECMLKMKQRCVYLPAAQLTVCSYDTKAMQN